MENQIRPPNKKNRSSGKHSRTGCGTCKIRRVKCDEGKPVCSRCVKFGIACDGYIRQSRTPSPRSRSQGPTLAPRIRTPSLPSISNSPLGSVFGPDEGGQYFDVFQKQTAFQITPFFDSDSFRIFILKSCSTPSIRHLVMAIGALAKSCMSSYQQDRGASRQVQTDPKVHHQAAIQKYSEALKLMRQASTQGCQDLKTTLTSSLLIACFEGAHGNYSLADAQIDSGLILLESWRNSHNPVDYARSIFLSPVPGEVDDVLFQAFVGLEIQSSSFGKRYTASQHRSMMYEGEEEVHNMPVRFANCQMAQAYLELIVRRLMHWMHSVEWSNKTEPVIDSMVTKDNSFQGSYIEDDFLYDLAIPSVGHHSNLQFEHIHYLSNVERWNSSFQTFLQQSPIPGWDLTSNLLLLGSKTCELLLNTVVGQTSISLEKDRANIEEIIRISRAVSGGLQTRSMTHFTVLQGLIDPSKLAEMLQDSSRQSRIDAISMLFRWPRQEGTSSSLFMGQPINCPQSIESNVIGTPDEVPSTSKYGVGATLGQDLYTMKVAYQGLMTPEGYARHERRRTIT